MRCPWCGSPVMIRGNSWECGYCGDCGKLNLTKSEEITLSLSLSLSISFEIDLLSSWQKMKDCLQTVVPTKAEQMLPELAKTVLYEISQALITSGQRIPEEKRENFENFLESTSDFFITFSTEEILRVAEEKVLCAAEGRLTEHVCGSFWRSLIDSIPDADYPDELGDIFLSLGSIYQYFVSDDCDSEDNDRRNDLRDAFERHWYDHKIRHPDVAAAIVQLQEGGAKDYDGICRSILISEFPKVFESLSIDELIDFQWKHFIEDMIYDDPVMGISMWRSLLDAAGSILKSDEALAEELLPDFIESAWLYDRDYSHLMPFVEALEDSTFIEQIFQCSGHSSLQDHLLKACRICDRHDLEKLCLK